MCGIAGYIEKRPVSSIETIRAMTNSQAYRGPDAEGFYFNSMGESTVALGHRRLSILDMADHANQPMEFENLVIVYNGEVYNYADIRNELQIENYVFSTQGDTEVVLKAFHKWGVSAVNKFRGMFAFCIVDKEQKKLWLVRDRAGVKPLYYYHDKQTLLFSSEVKSFQYHSCFKSEICHQGLNLYFQYGYIPAPWTIFSGARKVKPGHYIEYDLNNNEILEKQYWNLSEYYSKPKLSHSEQYLTDHLQSILSDSLKLRMISDVPVGVLLSGGIDSTLVASILQASTSTPIDTFTMGFNKADYDESTHARKIASYLGTHHHEKICTLKEAESVIPLIPKIYDEPFADTSAIPTALISEFVRKKVTVVLSGDGGDELFCGYDSYLINERRFRNIDKIPFKNTIAKMLDVLPTPIIANHDRYLKLKTVMKCDSLEQQYQTVTQTFTNYDLNKLLLTGSAAYNLSISRHDLSPFEKMMLVDFNQYLPDDLMVKVDRATMYYSLEGREPLLDHTILEYAAQIPIQYKKSKLILKNILKKYIPTEYFERKKHGFGVPINDWLRNELQHLLKKYFDPEKIIKQGIFNHDYITRLYRSFMQNKTDCTRIWTLLVFQMWYEEYFKQAF